MEPVPIPGAIEIGEYLIGIGIFWTDTSFLGVSQYLKDAKANGATFSSPAQNAHPGAQTPHLLLNPSDKS